MHFGAAIREVLTASCGSDFRHAKAHTVLPAPQSPRTLQLLAANLELAFGVTVPADDLARLTTVRDVLQCVRLRRWVKRVAAVELASPLEAATVTADASTPTPVAARVAGPQQGRFRFTRRSAAPGSRPLFDRPPATPGLKPL